MAWKQIIIDRKAPCSAYRGDYDVIYGQKGSPDGPLQISRTIGDHQVSGPLGFERIQISQYLINCSFVALVLGEYLFFYISQLLGKTISSSLYVLYIGDG